MTTIEYYLWVVCINSHDLLSIKAVQEIFLVVSPGAAPKITFVTYAPILT